MEFASCKTYKSNKETDDALVLGRKDSCKFDEKTLTRGVEKILEVNLIFYNT